MIKFIRNITHANVTYDSHYYFGIVFGQWNDKTPRK